MYIYILFEFSFLRVLYTWTNHVNLDIYGTYFSCLNNNYVLKSPHPQETNQKLFRPQISKPENVFTENYR